MAETESSVSELVRRTVEDSRKLVRSEIELAKEDLLRSAREAARGAVLIASGGALGLFGVGGLIFSLGLALPTTPARGTLLVSALLLGGAAACALVGFGQLPVNPLARTFERVGADVDAVTHARA